MKHLLEFYLKYCEFLYSDPHYRFTDSQTDGVNASITVTGANVTWLIAVDRGKIQLSVASTLLPGRGFWISLVRQYLNSSDNITYLSAFQETEWARENKEELEQLFGNSGELEATCAKLVALLRSNAEKEWGPTAPA